MLFIAVGAVFVIWGTIWLPRQLRRIEARIEARGGSSERLRRTQEGRGTIRVARIVLTLVGGALLVAGIVSVV